MIASRVSVPPSSWRSWFRRNATTMPVTVAGLVVVTLGTLGSLSSWMPRGLNDGAVVSAAVVSTTVYLSVIALGFGAWVGVTAGSSGLRRLERGRVESRALAPLTRVVAIVTVFASATAAVWAINAVAMLFEPDRSSTVSALLALYEMSAVGAMASIGYALGVAVPHLLTVPAVVLVGWFASSLLHGWRSLRMFWPRFVVEATVFDTWNTGTWLGSTLWFLGLAVLAALMATWTRSSRVHVRAAVVTVVVAVLGATVMSRTGFAINDRETDLAKDGQNVVGEVCEGETSELCLPAAFEGVRASLTEALSTLSTRTRGEVDLTRVELRPRGLGSKPVEGTTAIHLDDPLATAVSGAISELLIEGILDDQCWAPDLEDTSEYSLAITDWLSSVDVPSAELYAGGPTGIGEFFAWSESQRTAWLSNHWEEYRTCSLSDEDFA